MAIDRFDVLNQSRLSTYAIWWIRQAIQRAVASEAYPVRLNPRQLHRLALAGGMKGRGDHTARADKPRPALSPTMTKLFAATRPVHSLDALSRCDDTTSRGEFLLPQRQQDPHDYDTAWSVRDLISNLNARQQLVLRLRFGLGGESPLTLVQVGQVLGISKERVRQIQDRALVQLRASSAALGFPSE